MQAGAVTVHADVLLILFNMCLSQHEEVQRKAIKVNTIR